jgi:hypothetical protein
MEANLNDRGEGKGPRERREERCTAPHPASAFLLSLPAFVVAIGIALVLWKFLL